jgi:hypothetical protein
MAARTERRAGPSLAARVAGDRLVRFELYAAVAGLFDLLVQLPVHVAFAVAPAFLTDPTSESPASAAALMTRRRRALARRHAGRAGAGQRRRGVAVSAIPG